MTPLNYIGTLYRIIQESFVNMENMFDLMNQEVKATKELYLIFFSLMCKTNQTASPSGRKGHHQLWSLIIVNSSTAHLSPF